MAEPPSTKGKAPRVPSVAASADHPQSTAGPPASLIRWERFLPRRSLRVLLVEHDDSTRHVVGALLRKCNYHVAGVADGMKAWEVMTERKYCFDLVLTEVATPSLSGIGLLTRIVATEECKNIPVIMMSTHDSVNVVLKCMLKGAVDFLVKPVRKNELRNLWQHVWRRHCSSSYANASDNDTASNQISVDAGDQSKTGENNVEPSDFQEQSSGIKPDIDIESAQQQTEPAPDEDWTCTMKGGATLDQHDSDVANLASASNIDYGREFRGYKPVGVAVDVTSPVQEASKAEKSPGNHSNNISPSREENLDVVRYSKGDNDNHKSCCQNNASNGLVQKKVVFVEPISDGQYSYTVLKKDALVQGGLCKTTKSYHIGDTSNAGTSPLWELSLRRPQTNGCVDPELKENHVLKHSKASAFSRYGDKGIQSSWHKSYSSDLIIETREFTDKDDSYISSSGIDNEKSTPCSPTKSRLPSPRRNGDEATKYPQVSSKNEEKPPRDMSADHSSTMGDTALRHTPYGFMPLPIPVGAAPYHNLCGGFGTIMQPVFYPETSLAPLSSAAFGKPVIEIHHYPSSHHTSHLIKHPLSLELPRCEETHKSQHWRQAIDISEPGEQRELSCIPTEQAYQSGSCGHDVRKGSGSNGSGETADGAGATAAALESGNESGVQNCNRRALDYDRSRREAALLKFRMKRKERCFEKKVRYYSRKKLAEQRPRIKGQFVRQKILDSTASEADN